MTALRLLLDTGLVYVFTLLFLRSYLLLDLLLLCVCLCASKNKPQQHQLVSPWLLRPGLMDMKVDTSGKRACVRLDWSCMHLRWPSFALVEIKFTLKSSQVFHHFAKSTQVLVLLQILNRSSCSSIEVAFYWQSACTCVPNRSQCFWTSGLAKLLNRGFVLVWYFDCLGWTKVRPPDFVSFLYLHSRLNHFALPFVIYNETGHSPGFFFLFVTFPTKCCKC